MGPSFDSHPCPCPSPLRDGGPVRAGLRTAQATVSSRGRTAGIRPVATALPIPEFDESFVPHFQATRCRTGDQASEITLKA